MAIGDITILSIEPGSVVVTIKIPPHPGLLSPPPTGTVLGGLTVLSGDDTSLLEECADVVCPATTECGACTGDPCCGFCRSSFSCVKGTSFGPRDASHGAACGYWHWLPQSCMVDDADGPCVPAA